MKKMLKQLGGMAGHGGKKRGGLGMMKALMGRWSSSAVSSSCSACGEQLKLEADSRRSMLAIRLRRTGSKKRPFFRVVVTDSRAARDSSFVEVLGHYNPRTKPETLELERERLEHWVKVGAQPSDTVRTLVARMPPAPAADAGGGTARVVSRARDVVEVVARALADHPDAVRVTEREHKGQTLVELFRRRATWAG